LSYRVLVEVHCDEPECTNTIVFGRTNRGGMNKKMGGIFAREQGWWTAGGQHNAYANPIKALCPTHRPA
jgi:hypothetical protein